MFMLMNYGNYYITAPKTSAKKGEDLLFFCNFIEQMQNDNIKSKILFTRK